MALIRFHNSKISRRLGLAVTGLLLALAGRNVSHDAQQLRGLRVELAAEESTYTLRVPIYAVVSVQNGLSEAIEFDFGRNSKSSLAFSLTLPDGRLMDVAYPERDGGISMFTPRSLAPGETYKQRLLLNEWYDFSAPGAYTIQLRIDAGFRPLPIEKIVVWIGPRDDGQLGRVCRELLAVALSDIPVTERVDAADALSRVQDPLAIPYLKQIIETGVSVKRYGVQGLARIKTMEATDVLIANLGRDPEIQSSIVYELKTIERTTADPQLKARIRAALDFKGIP